MLVVGEHAEVWNKACASQPRVYADKNDLYMNAIRRITLTGFVKHLGRSRSGIARADERLVHCLDR